MQNEMPTFVGASYGASTTLGPPGPAGPAGQAMLQRFQMEEDKILENRVAGAMGHISAIVPSTWKSPTGEKPMATTRLVQVFVADPYDSVPLTDRLLYRSELKLTDADDQELFYELDIKSMIENHNVKRVTYPDKRIKDRVQMLEPARIRDLRMVVVTVASF